MELKNEPITDALQLIKDIFLILFEKKELIPINSSKSFVYVIGVAIWDIFSNNNRVISQNNKVYYLGSWRVSGDHIGEVIEENFKKEPFYDYMDFYKGSIYQLPKEIDLILIYEEIFKLLHQNNCDWQYASSGLLTTEIKNGKTTLTNTENNSLINSLKASYNKIIEKLDKNPTQIAIKAYKKVYGNLPTSNNET